MVDMAALFAVMELVFVDMAALLFEISPITSSLFTNRPFSSITNILLELKSTALISVADTFPSLIFPCKLPKNDAPEVEKKLFALISLKRALLPLISNTTKFPLIVCSP